MSVEVSAKGYPSDSAGYSPETRALVECARTVLGVGSVEGLQAALDACRSADDLCAAAIRQNLIGNLYKVIVTDATARADSALADRLGELQRAATVRSLRQTTSLLDLLDTLKTENIQAIPYKGPVWAQSLYGDVAMRTWSDLDLLVSHADVLRARSILRDHGFTDSNPFNERITRHRKGSLGQIAMHSSDAKTYVDLHWEVTVGISSRSLDPASVFIRRESLDLLGRSVWCPGKVDMLLVTGLEGTRDRWNTVEKMLGLGIQIGRMTAEEWPALIGRARDVGCLRRLSVGIRHTCAVLGVERVPAIEDVLAHDRMGRVLTTTLRRELMEKQAAGGPRRQMEKLAWGFATEDRLSSGLGHATRRLWQPGPEDWASYSLPEGLGWLYGTLRPARLMVKWLGHALGHERRATSGSARRKQG